MIVLGLHAFGHDAAAVLVADGMTLFASSQERFDRQRHSPAFPGAAIAAALATAGLQPEDVDAVAFPWTRSMGRPQKLAHVLRHLPRSRAFFREPADTVVADRRAYLHSMRGLEAQLRSQGFTAPVHRVPHHQAHAAAAALLLPGGDGAVLTADGMGEWTTAATWHARAHTLQRRARAVYPHSPGKAYAAVTQWLGFVPESDEGKTMGLAAYGDPASPGAAFARSLLRPHGRTLLRVDKGAFGFPWGEAQLYGARFLEALGPAGTGLGPERAGDADVARGIQDAVEAFARAAAEQVLARAEQPTLGLAGGLFLNCALNGSLLRAGFDVRPFPVAGDAGAAWGAASEVSRRLTGRAVGSPTGLHLGHEITVVEAGVVARRERMRSFSDPRVLAAAVAQRIAAGEIVAVARGRAEFGPRALGHRSLLATPTTTASRDRVNRQKGREAWRPLAPIVREGDQRWFRNLVASPHMILTFEATPAARAQLPGVVHVDGTARVQTVAAHGDTFIRHILDALDALGQPPVVINTSFNRRGEPIVNTAEEAWAAYVAIGADALVLDEFLHERTPGGAIRAEA